MSATMTSSRFTSDQRASITCTGCANVALRSTAPKRLTAEDLTRSLDGMMVWLPKAHHVPNSSVIHQQAGCRAGGFDHPAVVLKTSPCGHLVFCAQVTSWSGTTVQVKYGGIRSKKNVREIMDRYMAIKKDSTVEHNGLGMLAHSGDEMPKQSYVLMNEGYWIERQLLASITTERKYLTCDSYINLTNCFFAPERRNIPAFITTPVASQPITAAVSAPMVWRASRPSPAPIFVLPARQNQAVTIRALPSPPLSPPTMRTHALEQRSWRRES